MKYNILHLPTSEYIKYYATGFDKRDHMYELDSDQDLEEDPAVCRDFLEALCVITGFVESSKAGCTSLSGETCNVCPQKFQIIEVSK